MNSNHKKSAQKKAEITQLTEKDLDNAVGGTKIIDWYQKQNAVTQATLWFPFVFVKLVSNWKEGKK